MNIIDLIVICLMVCGFIIYTGGAVGILRFPDFYSRLHPAGKLDTMALLLTLSAMALYNLHHFSVAALLTSLKILMIVMFVFLTSPTATHAIVDAGVRAGLGPWVKRAGEDEK